MAEVRFTEADRKKLEALKCKERAAKMAEQKQRKEDEKVCRRLFGKSVDEIQSIIESYVELGR